MNSRPPQLREHVKKESNITAFTAKKIRIQYLVKFPRKLRMITEQMRTKNKHLQLQAKQFDRIPKVQTQMKTKLLIRIRS